MARILVEVLLTLLGLCQFGSAWKNSWDAPLNFQCPDNQYISWFRSIHDNRREDRLFDMGCRKGYVGTECSWTDYLNDWDKVVDFKCAHGGIVTGFHSIHHNRYEDRRWKIRCCKLVTKPGISCYITNWLADWDRKIDFNVKAGTAIVGMYSKHDNGKEDRLFKFRTCSFANCRATGMKILDQLRATNTGTRIVGISTTQGCSSGHEFALLLGGTDSVEETAAFTTTESESFTFETTITVTTEASIKFLGTGGSMSFGVSQMFGGSITYESSYEKATSIGRESSTATGVSFTGPGAALLMADVKEYRINTDRVNVEYDVVCDDGRRFKDRDVVSLTIKTYGVTHFSSYVGKFNNGKCSRSSNECIRRLEGEKALNRYSLVSDFKKCFQGIGSVSKK